MDIDTSFIAEPRANECLFSNVSRSAAPIGTGFNNLFYHTMSPRRSFDSPPGPMPKKRRSLSPVSPVSPGAPRVFQHDNSSSPMLPSLSQQKMEQTEGGPFLSRLSKPTLQGLGAPSSSLMKRPRRPALSAVVRPSEIQPTHSAYPILAGSGSQEGNDSPKVSPPTRRAFSALIPPPGFLESYSDESSFDGPDMSSPAQAYAKRQQVRTIRRCDGTEDFRPLTGATAMAMNDTPSSRFKALGMPGFGDNESHGKILPCHRVTEDGLMRISCQTVSVLVFPSTLVKSHMGIVGQPA
jgi:M-phase inducer tyrosine phosphatase